MIAFVKISLILVVLVCLSVFPISIPVILAALLLFALIVHASSVRPSEIVARNALVGLFAVFFMGMAALSALLRGDMPSMQVAELGGRIVLVFNAVYLGGRWLGTAGVMRLVDSLPSERLRLFLLLIVKQAHSFPVINRTVIDQLRSRLDMTKRDRLLVARFYVQNMIYGELRSYRHLQAALYTRLPERLVIYHRPTVFRVTDALVTGAVVLCVAAAFMSRWGGI